MVTCKEYEDVYTGRNYKKLTNFRFCLIVPEVEGELALLVEHDGRNVGEESAMLQLAEEGKAPYCAFLSIWKGKVPMKNGKMRHMRLDDYDLLTDEYANLLVEELIPWVKEKYALNLSDDPDMHMIAGGSSGGISSMAAAWFRNDYFHRVFMASPSFLSMARGNELPHLIKKTETKPIKIYEEYSENEPDEYFGSSYCVAIEAQKALAFAGYDFTCVHFPGEKHCSRYYHEDDAYVRLEWLWRNYKTEPVTVKANSPRVNEVIPFGSRWEKAESMPKKRTTPKILSADKQWYYYGSRDDDVVRAVLKGTDAVYQHGMLHTLPMVYPKGPIDMTLDEEDRLYVLTAIGIQCVRSFGLIDVILSLPAGEKPKKIVLAGNKLYLETDKAVWVREVCHRERSRKATEPRHIDYYD